MSFGTSPAPTEKSPTPGTPPEPPSIGPSKRRFFLWEIWLERRDAFKGIISDALISSFAVAKDVLVFTVILTGLIVVYWMLGFLERLGLPQDRKELFEKLHFYASLIFWSIFFVDLLYKTVLFLFRTKR